MKTETENKPKHTPSPWTKRFVDSQLVVTHTDEKGTEWYVMEAVKCCSANMLPREEETEANFALATASPLMYAALVEAVEDARCYCDDRIAMAGRSKCKTCVCREAIAAAEGRAP